MTSPLPSLLLLLVASTCCTVAAFLIPNTDGSRNHFRIKRIYSYPIEKSEAAWRSEINDDDAFYVLREKGTEPPGSSELNQLSPNSDGGILTCKACGAPLFSVGTKFDSGTGWPSFYAPVTSEAVDYSVDFDAILPRTECVCSQCGSHLGHVFEDGPAPTSLRYCMNGISMEYKNEQDESNENVIVIQQQDPIEATRLPLHVILPTFLTNMAVAILMFLSYWTKHDLPTTELGTVLVAVPLPFATYFAYTAAKSLTRVK